MQGRYHLLFVYGEHTPHHLLKALCLKIWFLIHWHMKPDAILSLYKQYFVLLMLFIVDCCCLLLLCGKEVL